MGKGRDKQRNILNEAIKGAVINSINEGTDITEACESAQISRTTFYAWLKDDNEFDKAITQAELNQVKVVEGYLKKQCEKGDTKAIQFFLCNRNPQKWRSIYSSSVQINNANNSIKIDYGNGYDKLGDDKLMAEFRRRSGFMKVKDTNDK